MWAVVHFEKEKTVDAVPSKWLLEKTRECFWPPKHWDNNKIKNAINNLDDPGENWKVYHVKILGEYDNLNKARKKVTKAMTTSDLSSHSESYVPPRKKKRFQQNVRSSSSSSGDETSVSGEIFPTLSPKKNIPLSPIVRILSPVAESSCTIQDTPRSRFAAENNDATDFQKQILRQLYIIKNMLVQQTESIDILMKQRNDNINEANTVHDQDNILEIINMMPIQTLDEIETIETALQNEELFKSMTTLLARTGGNTAKEIIRRIMYQTFSNNVGQEYSWEGAKKKKVFKNLKLANAILQAVRLNRRTRDSADDEIIFFIKAWLVRSKERILQKEKSTTN